jgi:hypothetical protein
LVDGNAETLLVSSGGGNFLKGGGEFNKLGGGGDVSEKEDYGSHFVGCDKVFDIFAGLMTVEANNKELLSVSKNIFPHYYGTGASISSCGLKCPVTGRMRRDFDKSAARQTAGQKEETKTDATPDAIQDRKLLFKNSTSRIGLT